MTSGLRLCFSQARALLALLPVLITSLAHADLVVLQYHHISTSTPASTSTSPELFRQQLDLIDELGLEVVPLDSGTRAALAGELDTTQQVALTFDDAYESVWSGAVPLLTRRGLPFTIFVNTDAVGTPGYMTWEQLEKTAAMDGALIANHSEDHGHLARRPGEAESPWHERVTRSLDRAQTTLQQKLGQSPPLFAYPYGEFDEALEARVAERGWYGYGQQSGPVGRDSTATRLPRFPMAEAYGQISSLPDKLLSRALPVDTAALPAGVTDRNPPTLTLTLPDPLDPGRLTCFATGQGRVDLQIRGQQVQVTPGQAFSSRRFRYNCTYPLGGGRFYWLSQQWLDQSRPED